MIPALIGVNAVILIACTTHITSSSTTRAKMISSGLMFCITGAAVPAFGAHLCKEGGAPLFVVLSTALSVAATPWFLANRVWLLRGIVVILASFGMLAASYLAESYHRDDITGNPKYSSGYFWHTLFTGQYPRDPSLRKDKFASGDQNGRNGMKSEKNGSIPEGAGQ